MAITSGQWEEIYQQAKVMAAGAQASLQSHYRGRVQEASPYSYLPFDSCDR